MGATFLPRGLNAQIGAERQRKGDLTVDTVANSGEQWRTIHHPSIHHPCPTATTVLGPFFIYSTLHSIPSEHRSLTHQQMTALRVKSGNGQTHRPPVHRILSHPTHSNSLDLGAFKLVWLGTPSIYVQTTTSHQIPWSVASCNGF